MTEWPGKADMLSFQITFDLCKASGNELAQSSTIFRYSVPIYVWIFENGLKELALTLISLNFIRP